MARQAPTSRNVFITGVGIGIGHAAALAFAAQGWRVFGSVKDHEELQALGAHRAQLADVYVVDIRDEEGLAEAAGKVANVLPQGEGLDVLLNNAGLASSGPLELTTTEQFRTVFEVNVYGTAAVTRLFLPLLRRAAGVHPGRSRQPCIIFMSSVLGRIALPYASVYAASKFAVEAMCDSLRLELKPQGIRVVAIEPVFVKTNLPKSMFQAAAAALQAAPAALRNLYEPPFQKTLNAMHGMVEHLDVGVSDVVTAIVKAANQQTPPPRRPVGYQAFLFLWLRHLLPDTWWDACLPHAERMEQLLAGFYAWVKQYKQSCSKHE